MKRKEFNAISSGASGKFGDQVTLVIRNGEQLICKCKGPSSVPPTEKQKGVTSRFKRAAAWATNIIKDLSVKEFYRALTKGKGSAYTTAVADYCKSPEIIEVVLTYYNGAVGGRVVVNATDNVKVETVTVKVLTPAGDLLEGGPAVLEPDTGHWSYEATQPNENVSGSQIIVTATDIPGNETIAEITLP